MDREVAALKEFRMVRLLGDDGTVFQSQSWMTDCRSMEDLLGEAGSSNGVILDGDMSKETVITVIQRLRNAPATCFKPIFCSNSVDESLIYLTDGLVDSTDKARAQALEMEKLSEEIDLGSLKGSRDFRLLAYLLSRPKGLNPVLRPFTHDVYGFPMADMIGGGEDSVQWLKNLRDRGVLALGSLVDRIRLCPKCSCTHLNYIDVCPSCGSIDIALKEFIHCFTCGRVGPEEDFLQESGYRCPFCSTHLRHLGSDYDHPLESFVCNDCAHRFVEADVVVDCFCCRARSKTDELLVEAIRVFRISEKGKTAARTGSIEDVYALLDRLNYVVPAYFDQLLDWMILLNRRYPDEVFSLLGVRFANLDRISDSIGRQRTTQMMDAIAGRLRELIRSTDVSTRTGTGLLWLLLPRTDSEGASVLEGRILELAGMVDGSIKPDLRSIKITAPEDIQDGVRANNLMTRLTGELEG